MLRIPASALTAVKLLTRDGLLLFLTRFVRLFAYGSLSLILVFYLTGIGLDESQTGLIFTLTLIGDTVISLYLTTQADRIGRRRMLIAGAILMAAAGAGFACTSNFFFLIIAGTIGVISPTGNEVGPFLSIEQAALSQIVLDDVRTEVFAWYTLAGSLASAMGSLLGGLVTQALQRSVTTPVGSYRAIIIFYAAVGVFLAVVFRRLSAATEIPRRGEETQASSVRSTFLGIGTASRKVVLKLSGLFAIDAFAGAFVVQSFAVYWFHLRFGAEPGTLGVIFFWANVFAGFSALLASRLASRFGLVRTMVFTHLPSNVLLILVPLMPNLSLATALLLLRFSISQMDVPTRQSYTMAVVRPEERSAAAGITTVARTTGAAIAPFIAGLMFARPALINVPFYMAGTLKIVYDLLLYHDFKSIKPPEESEQ
ncbi:MAG TPA: MFS transporter [Candidatus Binatia bacterium]|jgi:MFS family permease